MFATICVFIIVLSLLIFVHELGHFVTAKRLGVKVEEFGFGYPPRVFGIRKGGTIYSINLLPLGGFVKIYGQIGEETIGEDKEKMRGLIIGDKEDGNGGESGAFFNQPIWSRALILVAGVVMNIFLAMVLLGIGHWLGLPAIVEDGTNIEYISDPKVQVLEVAPGSPAESADIRIGDTITGLRVAGELIEIDSTDDIGTISNREKGEEIAVIVQRGEEELLFNVVPRVDYPADEGPLGIALASTAIVRYPWYLAIYKGVADTIYLTWAIVVAFAGLFAELFSTGKLTSGVAGPVGIFNITSQAAKLGLIYVLQFTALFSINLAILNILPLPALDGGRLFFLLIEKIKGSPVSEKIEKWTHLIGFALIVIFMLVVTWRDIVNLF